MRPSFMRSVTSFALVALLATGCNRSTAAQTAQGKAAAGSPPQVTTVKPERKTIRRTTDQPGRVKAFEETPLYAKISGYVIEPKVDIGDSVTKGQLLAELSVPEMDQELKQKESLIAQAKAERAQAEAGVQAAEAAVATARAKIEEAEAARKKTDGEYERWKLQLERDERLAEDGTIQKKLVDETRNQFRATDSARDETTAKVKSAKTNLTEMEAKLAKAQADVTAADAKKAVADDDYKRMQALLEYAKIVAPYDGVVSQRNVDTWHFIPASGTREPLFVVMRTDPVRVFVDVPEKDTTQVRQGARAIVRVEALNNQEFEGAVTRNAWALNPTARTLRTEIDIPNADGKLRPGMYCYASIVIEAHADVLALPVTALVKQGDKTLCCVVSNGKVARKPIKLGISDGTLVEVADGLNGTEDVVKANAGSLNDGQAVQVTSAAK